MANTNTGSSKGLGLAIATAVTGLVLAGGISVASLLGWVKPAASNNVSAQTLIAAAENIPVAAPATLQVVLVPIAPTSPQLPAADSNAPSAGASHGNEGTGGASRASQRVREQRPAVERPSRGERDDD